MQFAAVLGVHRLPIELLVLSQGTERAWTLPFERFPLYPRGPHSGPGYSVPVHHPLERQLASLQPLCNHTRAGIDGIGDRLERNCPISLNLVQSNIVRAGRGHQ